MGAHGGVSHLPPANNIGGGGNDSSSSNDDNNDNDKGDGDCENGKGDADGDDNGDGIAWSCCAKPHVRPPLRMSNDDGDNGRDHAIDAVVPTP
jgi:hypothetical protein